MAYSTLRAAIQAAIKQNDNEEITGNLLQSVLLSIVNTVGAGYNFAGVATPSTNPGTPDGAMFWIGGKGTYANFGSSVTIAAGYLGIFMWDGSAFTRSVLKLSGGEGVFDVTDYTGNEYANLSAALAAIPQEAKAGGMQIRFVQNTDNKYVQYRLMSNTFNTTPANWQGVDDEPTVGSNNLVKSGGIVSWSEENYGKYYENLEFIEVKLDANKRILWAIKNDGTIYYGAGVPPQVIDYIQQKIEELSLDEYEDIVTFLNGLEEGENTLQQLLNLKVNKANPELTGKISLDKEIGENDEVSEASVQHVYNPEFVAVWLDKDKKILFGVQIDGNFIFGCGVPQQIVDYVLANKEELQSQIDSLNSNKADKNNPQLSGKISFGKEVDADTQEINEVSIEAIECPEWIDVALDKNKKILGGYKADGKFYADIAGIPSKVQECLDDIDARVEALENEEEDTPIVSRNKEAINNINAAQKHFPLTTSSRDGNSWPKFTIAHITDIHNDIARTRNFNSFVNHLGSRISTCIFTGDFVYLPVEAHYQDIMPTVDENSKILKVVGNHEKAQNDQSTQIYYYNTRAEMYSNLNMNTDTGKLYYYKDYMNQYRVIVLNQYDSDDEKWIDSEYSQEQLDWFVNTLKDAATNNLHVFVCKHAPETLPSSNNKGFYQRFFPWGNRTWDGESETLIEDIINAFKTGTTINKTFTNGGTEVTVNTTFDTAGVFAAYICGHTHEDCIGYSSKYSDQLYLCCSNSGVNKSSGSSYCSVGEESQDVSRIVGTRSEDCFNVYVMDYINKLVRVIRVGADITDDMEDRKKACFSY